MRGAQGLVIGRRSIVMVRGDRVRGAIRDPEEYLTVNGHRYGETLENLQYISKYLNETNNGKYTLPNKLLLQVITHKSFSHGAQPFNDKLSILGFQMLKLYSSTFAVSRPTKSQFAVSGFNFDCLGSMVSKNLLSDKCLAQFSRDTGISKIVFWKKALRLNHDPKASGEERIFSTITTALIGLINLHHGSSVAQEFIQKELLENDKTSIVKTSVEMTTKNMAPKKQKPQNEL